MREYLNRTLCHMSLTVAIPCVTSAPMTAKHWPEYGDANLRWGESRESVILIQGV
jgi:hypothetical protein